MSYCKFGYFRENFISRVALKLIFATLKIRDNGVIYLYQKTTAWFRHFVMNLFSRNFAYAKFRENLTLAKISELTVLWLSA